jgi:RimJ/RimL family protein N-acetyltransferase
MFELQRLRPDHEPAVLAFEQANRAYFADFVSDRGDDFYEQFAERHRALLAEQETGACVFHVLVDEDETVVGRFNLYDLVNGTAEVGYRVGQRVAGRGVATSALQDLCRIAREQYGLRTLRAAISNDNVASQRVITKVGFVATGPAEVGGRQGSRYELALTPATRDRS